MTSPIRHRALAGASRARLLDVLRASREALGIGDLAAAVGLHSNTVRAHLQQLLDAGLVVQETARPVGRGRPGLRFRADPDAGDDDPEPYRALARVLTEQLAERGDAGGEATAAGDRWGRSLAVDLSPAPTAADGMQRMVQLLDDAGFAPDAPVGTSAINLRRCPFGTLAVGRERVVCGVHLGLMRGALATVGAPLEATRLEPFVRPDLCVAHFEATAGD
ncbi:MAG TPA: helix-turn-helix domain-containing protein [Candidatus Limnocylindria bacterium]|nr:helix-turn-helix domain-containing protein [Candidatus Limnocylindria bacterium]